MVKMRLLLSAGFGALLLASPMAMAQQSTVDKAKTEIKEDYNKVKSEITGKTVQLSAVPTKARAAGKAALPDTTFTEAKQSTENGATVYELEGKDKAKKSHSVHVTAAGKVLRKS